MMPDHLPVDGIPTNDERLDDALDDHLVRQRDIAWAEGLAPSGQTLVGADLDQVSRALGVVLLRVTQLVGKLVLQDVADDLGDLHRRACQATSPREIRFGAR